MADEISIGKQAIKEVQDLRAELVKLSEDALKAGKNLSSISTPSNLNKNGADNAKIGAELDALKVKYTQLNETIVKKAEQSRLAEIRLQQQREKAFDSFEKNAKKEADLLEKNNSLYYKTQQQVNALTKSYNDLAIKKQLGETLSKKEERQLISLQAQITTYQNALLKTDTSIGKYGRSVGNYASGYNALGNSISQLSREMPAFANSAQTGFMAISNNIPAFQDAIMQLRAGGMSWGGILKEMGGALFGLTGIISLATTLLVVLGPKLIDWITNTDDEKEATDKLTSSLKKQNEQLRIYNENISHQNVLAIENAKQRGASLDEINKIERKSIEDQLKNFEIIRDARKRDFDDFVKKEARKRMPYFASPIGFAERLKIMEKAVRAEVTLQKNALTEAENAVKKQGFVLSELIEKQQTEKVESTKKNNEKFNSEVLKVGEKFAKKELEALAESEHDKYRLLVKQSFEELDLAIKTDSEKIKQMEISEEEKQLLLLTNAKNAIIARRNISDAMIAEEKKIFAKESAELKNLSKGTTGGVAGIKDVNKSSSDALKAMEKQQQAIEKSKKSMEDLHKATTDWLGSFSSEFLSNSGFSNLETFFDGTFKKILAGAETTKEKFAVTFNAVAESAQEMYNFISNASQGNFDAEKERLQSQYDVAYGFANGNKEAEKKLADDLEAHKKDIANRENKAKQKQAMFNIAVDTAQAILGLWANPGFPAAIPLSIAVGALGAAQIAIVASQKVPQYFMGGTHEGGLMMVNDGAGSNYRETIVTPDGKIMQPTGRNVLMDAPAGTEIFTHNQWEQQLNDMLQSNGINWHNHQQSHGISKADLRDVMLETIGSQPTSHTNFDENGVSKWMNKQGNITRQATNRGNGRGVKFT